MDYLYKLRSSVKLSNRLQQEDNMAVCAKLRAIWTSYDPCDPNAIVLKEAMDRLCPSAVFIKKTEKGFSVVKGSVILVTNKTKEQCLEWVNKRPSYVIN